MAETNLFSPLLERAGVGVNGRDPWDMQVHNPGLWQRIAAEGSLGLGEAYMDGWWDCADLAEFFNRILRAREHIRLRLSPARLWQLLQARVLNMQDIARSRRVAKLHYSETDAYAASLDRRMTGSCAYWPEGVSNIDEAQEAKLDLVCRKIQLKPGERVLDIGCGWGAFMGFAAEKYGAECVGVTVSPDQAEYGRKEYQGLPVAFEVKDYREFDGKVDKVVSMGMFEHVGYKNFRTYFEAARRALRGDGLFMLHTVGRNDSRTTIDPWLEKYIFPGGVIPSLSQIGRAIEKLWTVIDLHNIGPHYDRTLLAWNENFERKWLRRNTPEDVRFYRMWRYYLLCCAGGFRSRVLQVWQFVLSTNGVPEGYKTAR